MDRAVMVALFVALFVAGSLVGTATGGPPAIQPPSSSASIGPASAAQVDDDREPPVEMLGVDSPTRSVVTSQGVDVSVATSMQREAVASEIDRGGLAVAFERADDEQARRQLLFEAATDVEIATSALRADQRDVRADYVNGTITPRAYTRSRVMADVRTEELRSDLELIQRYANRVPQLSMRSRIEALQVALTGAEGPVSDRLGATTVGDEPAVELYVAASPNGRVLAVISGDEYVREAYRADVWTPDTTSGIGFAQAEGRMTELYPVAFSPNSSRNLARGMGENGAGTYRVTMEIREGDIVTYLDGDTRNVFFEVQRFSLDRIEPGPAAAVRENGTRLAVNRTHAGGPLRIATYDNSTGAPVGIPVFVGETRYRTGSDGVVWALAPEDRTTVRAVGESGNASVSHVPTPPSLVNVSTVGTETAGNIQVTPRERSAGRAEGSEA